MRRTIRRSGVFSLTLKGRPSERLTVAVKEIGPNDTETGNFAA
jgi:hypothetical protein